MTQTQATSTKAEGWTFGIEIECLIPNMQVRSLGIRIGSYHYGLPLPAPFPTGWTAEHDGSVYGDGNYTGLEIVSPILQGKAGIDQVKQVAQTLNEIGARVDRRCGFHVHVGAEIAAGGQAWVAEWVAKLLYQMAMHEKAIYASTGTRRRENGSYSTSIKAQQQEADRIRKASSPSRKREELSWVASRAGRYHSLNLTNLFTSKATVEFRAFAGTTEWQKMLGHICTCLALCERARETARMDWNAMASRRTYQGGGEGARALQRFFYLTGWTKGRRQVGQPEVAMAGWIADLGDLDTVKHELMRLAKKYDAAGGF